jgi:hypothetical protein
MRKFSPEYNTCYIYESSIQIVDLDKKERLKHRATRRVAPAFWGAGVGPGGQGVAKLELHREKGFSRWSRGTRVMMRKAGGAALSRSAGSKGLAFWSV